MPRGHHNVALRRSVGGSPGDERALCEHHQVISVCAICRLTGKYTPGSGKILDSESPVTEMLPQPREVKKLTLQPPGAQGKETPIERMLRVKKEQQDREMGEEKKKLAEERRRKEEEREEKEKEEKERRTKEQKEQEEAQEERKRKAKADEEKRQLEEEEKKKRDQEKREKEEREKREKEEREKREEEKAKAESEKEEEARKEKEREEVERKAKEMEEERKVREAREEEERRAREEREKEAKLKEQEEEEKRRKEQEEEEERRQREAREKAEEAEKKKELEEMEREKAAEEEEAAARKQKEMEEKEREEEKRRREEEEVARALKEKEKEDKEKEEKAKAAVVGKDALAKDEKEYYLWIRTVLTRLVEPINNRSASFTTFGLKRQDSKILEPFFAAFVPLIALHKKIQDDVEDGCDIIEALHRSQGSFKLYVPYSKQVDKALAVFERSGQSYRYKHFVKRLQKENHVDLVHVFRSAGHRLRTYSQTLQIMTEESAHELGLYLQNLGKEIQEPVAGPSSSDEGKTGKPARKPSARKRLSVMVFGDKAKATSAPAIETQKPAKSGNILKLPPKLVMGDSQSDLTSDLDSSNHQGETPKPELECASSRPGSELNITIKLPGALEIKTEDTDANINSAGNRDMLKIDPSEDRSAASPSAKKGRMSFLASPKRFSAAKNFNPISPKRFSMMSGTPKASKSPKSPTSDLNRKTLSLTYFNSKKQA
eukprot:g5579.t1